MPRKKHGTRVVIDTMIMKGIALAGLNKANDPALSVYKKITSQNHTVIISNQLSDQYLTIMEKENIPAEYFLQFFLNTMGNQIKKVSDSNVNKMQVKVKLPPEDVFLAQIALASNPNKFNVFIISKECGIYKKDRQLQRKHNVRALTPEIYSTQFC